MQAQQQAPKEPISCLNIARSELYNLLQTSGFLIIDCRPNEAFLQNHIKTALPIDSVNILSACQNGQTIATGIVNSLRTVDKPRWASRSYSHVIVYNGGSEDQRDLEILIAFLLEEKKVMKLSKLEGRHLFQKLLAFSNLTF